MTSTKASSESLMASTMMLHAKLARCTSASRGAPSPLVVAVTATRGPPSPTLATPDVEPPPACRKENVSLVLPPAQACGRVPCAATLFGEDAEGASKTLNGLPFASGRTSVTKCRLAIPLSSSHLSAVSGIIQENKASGRAKDLCYCFEDTLEKGKQMKGGMSLASAADQSAQPSVADL